MSDINTLITAIQTKLDDKLANVSVEEYADQFTEATMRKVAINPPVVWLHLVDAQHKESGTEQLMFNCQFSLYCIAKVPNSHQKSKAKSLLIAQQAAKTLHFNRFGVVGAGVPEQIIIKPASSAYLLQHGIALTEVKFQQKIMTGESVFDSQPDFIAEEVWLGISPEIGIPHIDDYTKVHPNV
jgi:phage gp37-like protein